MRVLTGRIIRAGQAQGVALVSPEPVGFFGLVDTETGVVIEKGHPLEGKSIAGRVLVFPTGKGSTVGSYSLYRLAKAGRAPAAIINLESEPIVAVGAIISEIPMLDKVDVEQIHSGDVVMIDGAQVIIDS
jgi:predicted aconitase with swiveling domain